MFMAAASVADVFAGRFLARAFGAQTVEHGARRLDAEAVGVLQVGGKLVEHMAFERTVAPH